MSNQTLNANYELQAPARECALADFGLIERIVEATLLAATHPLNIAQLYALFPDEQPAPRGSIEQAIEALQQACANRGVMLVEVASGFRYQVRREVQPWVSRLFAERPQRYTRATLETLALIAYRQPITRGEIEAVRGVGVNANLIKMLEEREWIRVVGHRDVPGRPALFGTTKLFLDYFNLKSLDELPPLSEIRDLGELDPQLPLEEPLPLQVLAAVIPDVTNATPPTDDDVVTTSNSTTDESDDAVSDRTP